MLVSLIVVTMVISHEHKKHLADILFLIQPALFFQLQHDSICTSSGAKTKICPARAPHYTTSVAHYAAANVPTCPLREGGRPPTHKTARVSTMAAPAAATDHAAAGLPACVLLRNMLTRKGAITLQDAFHLYAEEAARAGGGGVAHPATLAALCVIMFRDVALLGHVAQGGHVFADGAVIVQPVLPPVAGGGGGGWRFDASPPGCPSAYWRHPDSNGMGKPRYRAEGVVLLPIGSQAEAGRLWDHLVAIANYLLALGLRTPDGILLRDLHAVSGQRVCASPRSMHIDAVTRSETRLYPPFLLALSTCRRWSSTWSTATSWKQHRAAACLRPTPLQSMRVASRSWC